MMVPRAKFHSYVRHTIVDARATNDHDLRTSMKLLLYALVCS